MKKVFNIKNSFYLLPRTWKTFEKVIQFHRSIPVQLVPDASFFPIYKILY